MFRYKIFFNVYGRLFCCKMLIKLKIIFVDQKSLCKNLENGLNAQNFRNYFPKLSMPRLSCTQQAHPPLSRTHSTPSHLLSRTTPLFLALRSLTTKVHLLGIVVLELYCGVDLLNLDALIATVFIDSDVTVFTNLLDIFLTNLLDI